MKEYVHIKTCTYTSQAPHAHTCNSSYLGGWNWDDHAWRPAWANSLWDPISKITRAKWTGGVAWAVEYLFCKLKALSSNTSPTKKKKELYINVYRSITHNGQKMWTPQMSFSVWMGEQLWCIIRWSSVVRRNGVLIHAIKWVNLGDFMLSERSQPQRLHFL
jgi:hypothetical protein